MQRIDTPSETQWFVMRDLKRSNAKDPAYKMLAELGFEVFTPMKTQITVTSRRRIRKSVPFIQDLLFVYASRQMLDPIVLRTETLQYRYAKGGAFCEPMTVRKVDMQRFIMAVNSVDMPRYFDPSEVSPKMYGKRIRLICDGPLDGYEGNLLCIQGSRKKRLIIELPGILTAAVEVNPDFIQFV